MESIRGSTSFRPQRRHRHHSRTTNVVLIPLLQTPCQITWAYFLSHYLRLLIQSRLLTPSYCAIPSRGPRPGARNSDANQTPSSHSPSRVPPGVPPGDTALRPQNQPNRFLPHRGTQLSPGRRGTPHLACHIKRIGFWDSPSRGHGALVAKPDEMFFLVPTTTANSGIPLPASSGLSVFRRSFGDTALCR